MFASKNSSVLRVEVQHCISGPNVLLSGFVCEIHAQFPLRKLSTFSFLISSLAFGESLPKKSKNRKISASECAVRIKLCTITDETNF